MGKHVKGVAAALITLAIWALFCTWVTWGESPATWLPQSRFIVGFIAIVAMMFAYVYAVINGSEDR